MLKKLVGRSLNPATSILNNQTVRNQVSASNPADLFRVNLGSSQLLNIKFRSRGHAAQINLIHDQNQNGLVDSNEVVKQAAMRSGKSGSIQVPSTPAGTYFIQVNKSGQGTSKYQFKLVAAPNASGNTTTTNSNINAPDPSIVSQILSLTNKFRQENGLAPLRLNNQLTNAAQTHTQNMALQDFVSHTGADGSLVSQRVSATGYKWSLVAENIAAGYQTAADVVQGWINSPGHRANLLNASVTELGVGYYFLSNDTGNENWTYYWTQVFGEPT
jgi:uncharacterized protein YkwD